jgi:hypothetical protein
MRKICFLSFLSFFIFIALSLSAYAYDPLQVSTLSAGALTTSDSRVNTVAIDVYGNSYVVYSQQPTTGSYTTTSHIFIKKSIDKGASWQHWNGTKFTAVGTSEVPLDITSTPSNQPIGNINPSIAIGQDGVIFVVWSAHPNNTTGNSREIFYTRFNGISWLDPLEVTIPDSPDKRSPAIDVDTMNRPHIVWYNLDTNSLYYEINYVHASLANDTTTSWYSTQLIGTTVDNTLEPSPSIVISGSSVHIAWRCHDADGYRVYYRKSTDGGSFWQTAIPKSDDTYKAYSITSPPSIALKSDNTAYIAWSQQDPNNTSVSMMVYTNDVSSSPECVYDTSAHIFSYTQPSFFINSNNHFYIFYKVINSSTNLQEIQCFDLSTHAQTPIFSLTGNLNGPWLSRDGKAFACFYSFAGENELKFQNISIPAVSIPTSLSASPITHVGNTSDIQISFTNSNETNVNGYKIFLVPEASISDFNINIASENSYCHSITTLAGSGQNYCFTLPADLKDYNNYPVTLGNHYKIFIYTLGKNGYVSALTSISGTITISDLTPPTTQNTVFASSATKKGGATVSIESSGDSTNSIWFAPSGTTTFTEGSTMTKASSGTATSILAPSAEGDYKLFVIDTSNNVSSASTATLTVDNTPPAVIITTPSLTTPSQTVYNVSSITVSGTSEAGSTINISRTSGGSTINSSATGNTFSFSISLVPNSINYLTITSTDAAGNVNSETFTITHKYQVAAVSQPSASDVADSGKASDIQVSFTKLIDQANVASYKVFVAPSTQTLALDAALALDATKYQLVQTTAVSTVASSVYTFTLSDNLLDTQGNAIGNGSSYKIYVMTVGNDIYVSNLSTPSSAVTLGISSGPNNGAAGGAPPTATQTNTTNASTTAAKTTLTDTAKQTTVSATDAKTASQATQTIATALTNTSSTDEQKAADLSTAAQSVSTLATIISKVNDAAANAELIQKTTTLIGAIASAANSISDETNAVQAATSISEALKNSASLLSSVHSGQDNNAIANQVLKLYAAIISSANKINSEPNAENVIKSISQTLGTTQDVVKATQDASTQQQVLESTKNVLQNAPQIINKINTSNKIVQAAENIIKNSVSISATASNEIVNVAEKAVEKIGKETAASTADGQMSKALITDEMISNIAQKAQDAANASKNLETALAQSNITKTLEAKVVLDVQKQQGTNTVKTTFPANLISTIKDTGIQNIQLSAGIASLTIPTTAISTTNVTQMAISIKQMDNQKDLTLAQKTLIGNHPVFQFNAAALDNKGKAQNLKHFNNSIEIAVPYTLKPGEDPNRITVMLYTEDKDHLENPNDNSKIHTLQPVVCKYDPETKTIRFLRKTFSMYTIMQINRNFDDLTKFAWAKKEIEMMAAKGIISGRTSKTFDPGAKVTKAEFVSMITRTLGLMDTKATVNFKDVKQKDWYYTAIASAYKAGIIGGSFGGIFEPTKNITRLEMSIMLSNAMTKVLGIDPLNKEKTEAMLNSYADKNYIVSWARNAVALCIKQSILKGQQSLINVQGNSNRAETAAIMKRLYDLI